MQQLSAQQLADWLADASRTPPLLVDVREPWEVELCSIGGSQTVPMHRVPQEIQAFDPDAEIVVICHHGVRSLQVAMFLEHEGFAKVFNLAGGIEAWACDIDPSMRRY